MSGALAAPARRTRRLAVWLLVALGAIGVAAANAHLVVVAFESQPACVDHARTAGAPGTYRAAKSAC